MKKSKFSETKVLAILKEAKAGMSVSEINLARRFFISARLTKSRQNPNIWP